MSVILVIEDEVDLAEAIKYALQSEGHEVILAGDGQAGIEKLQERRPDLVLLDVMMPVLDGRDVLERIKRHPELDSLPIIVMSAGENYQLISEYRRPFMRKPFEIDTLMHLVNREIAPPTRHAH